jgi:phosphonate transport system substrate-binding protein
MFHRRTAIALVALAALATIPNAHADYKAEFKELRFAITSGENEKDAMARFDTFRAYLTQRLGLPVTITRGTDYAAVVEALRARKVEFARMGPAAYARAVQVMGSDVMPVAKDMDLDGNVGYHSIIVVPIDSPYRTVADLKGKSLAFADPNSGSGFMAPTYFLTKQGMTPSQFFAKTGFAGNHEQGVMAVLNGTYDAAATWWNNETRSNVLRMEEKKMIPAGRTRIVWTSPMIPNSPWVARKLPDDLIAAYRAAVLDMPTLAPEVWKALTDGLMMKPVPATHQEYEDAVRMIEENSRNRRAM